MKSPFTPLWSALAFMGLAGLVAWMWQSYPRVEPLGQAGAAWVQAVGSILAIVVSAAFALGVPIYLDRQRVEKHRRAITALLDAVSHEMHVQKFRIEVGGVENTKHVPPTFQMLADQLDRFPVHNLDDPASIKDIAEAVLYLRKMVRDIEPELHRPRFVWERIYAYEHAIWQRSVWAKHRFGWGPANVNGKPARAFGTDPFLGQHFTWDSEGNPTPV